MTTTINASTTAGLVNTADTSGVLALQTAGTTAVSISASQVVTLTNAIGGGPTVQVFTSGSGTYTSPAGVKDIRVTLVGGGGGGGGINGSGAAGGGGGGAGAVNNAALAGGAGAGGIIIVEEFYA